MVRASQRSPRNAPPLSPEARSLGRRPLRGRGRRRSLWAGLVAVLLAALIGYAVDEFRAGVAAADGAAVSPELTRVSAQEMLEDLPVKGRAPKTGYHRTERFGPAWFDVDRNGCDTRNDVLQRDLESARLEGPCRVLSGVLEDPYTGAVIDFERGEATSPLVQIDHVVALSDAWQKGAQGLTQEERLALANDPLNLLAVDGATNNAKGDGDAATWLPPNREFRCEYVARQISVKTVYGLWVTEAERTAMTEVLGTCPEQPAVTSP